jgi:DnaJ-class molecular chaperone
MVARAFLTPPSFRQYGWYRGDALEEIASRKPSFAGRKACDECHSDQFLKLAKGEHKKISCETCHGPGQSHADDPDIKLHKPSDSDCMRCHESNPSRPTFLKQITLSDHFSGQRCAECHMPHHPTEVP